MFNNLKEEMDKEFNKNNNYQKILSRVNNGKNLNYLAVPAFVIIIALVVLIVYQVNLSKTLNETVIIGENNIKIELNENNLSRKEFCVTSLDVDIKEVKLETLPKNFEFINLVKLPEEVELVNSSIIYTRNDTSKDEYDILNDYVFLYNSKDNNKKIKIAFSESDKPIRDYFIDSTGKKSRIGNTELEVFKYNGMYIVNFSYNNINFDIETNGITQDELITLLISIIKND